MWLGTLVLFVTAAAFQRALPTSAYEYFATILPVLHVLGVAREVEAAELHAEVRRAKVRALMRENSLKVLSVIRQTRSAFIKSLPRFSNDPSPNGRPALAADLGELAGLGDGPRPSATRLAKATAQDGSHLPLPVSIALFIIAVAAVLSGLYECRDRYPFGDWSHRCRPCRCSTRGELESCVVPGELGVTGLYLADRGIRGIRPRAFRGCDHLYFLWLDRNNISRLAAGTFGKDLPRLAYLMIEHSGVVAIEEQAFERELGQLYHRTSLRTLNLRGNRIAALSKSTFPMPGLEFLFLESNGIVEIAPETLRPLRNLYALWLSENSINCSDVREQLRAQTVCLDQGVCQVPADELVFVGWDFWASGPAGGRMGHARMRVGARRAAR